MPTILLGSKKYHDAPFTIPYSGKAFTVSVEASAVIDIFILNHAQFEDFKKGPRPGNLTPIKSQIYNQAFTFAQNGGEQFHLVLANGSENPVAVHWVVY